MLGPYLAMQPGYSYTQDDFSQPAFCAGCGAHVPKVVLAATGGFCPNCAARLGPGSGYAAVPKRPFWQTSGCVALLLFILMLGLLAWAMMHFLGLSVGPRGTLVRSGGHGAGQSIVKAPSSASEDVDRVKALAAQFIDANFGSGIVADSDIDVTPVSDSKTGQITYRATGNFPGVVKDENVNVQFTLDYDPDPKQGFVLTAQEAYFRTTDGVEQYDFNLKEFIRLAH